MDRSTIKESGRRKLIRDRANALKDKPPRKAPTKEAIKQAGRYHAIETAKKQFAEAQQTIAQRRRQAAKKNAFHRETQKASASSLKKPSAKYLMRREAVKEYKRKNQAEKRNSFHHETQFEPDEAVKSAERTKEQMRCSYVRKVREQTDYPTTEKDAVVQPFSRGTSAHTPKRREEIAPAQHKTSTETQPNPIQSAGQRQTALPHCPVTLPLPPRQRRRSSRSRAAGMPATRRSRKSEPARRKACPGKQQRRAATFSRSSVQQSQKPSPPAGKRCFMGPGRWCLLSFHLWSLWAWPLCLPAAAKDAAPMCPSARR